MESWERIRYVGPDRLMLDQDELSAEINDKVDLIEYMVEDFSRLFFNKDKDIFN